MIRLAQANNFTAWRAPARIEVDAYQPAAILELAEHDAWPIQPMTVGERGPYRCQVTPSSRVSRAGMFDGTLATDHQHLGSSP